MIVSHLSAKNWRNFQHVAVDLRERQFIVGANASGNPTSWMCSVSFVTLRNPKGAGSKRPSKIGAGCRRFGAWLHGVTRKSREVHLAESAGEPPTWRYALGLRQETRGYRNTYLTHERVWKGAQQVLDRPDAEDRKDQDRLTQTFLEQINVNGEFRAVVRFFQATTYLHLVPQLLRFADFIQGRILEDDPFGQGLLERLAKTSEKTRRSRLLKIEKALKVAVPQLEQLQFVRDSATGRPHIQALYSHWRPKAGLQREDQFSDGTLRLIGFLWSLLEGDSLLLLEEPELSLNALLWHNLPLLSPECSATAAGKCWSAPTATPC